MTETITRMIKAANGWLVRSLLAVVFLGLTGWVAYNTHAADKTDVEVAKVSRKAERHDADIESLKTIASTSVSQQEAMMLQLMDISNQLASQKEVLNLIKDGRLIIK